MRGGFSGYEIIGFAFAIDLEYGSKRSGGKMHSFSIRQGALCCIVALLLFGCIAAPPARRIEGYSSAVGDKAADTALTMLGRPYKYKGDSPSGFDCSGLVRYSYLSAGMDVPHSTSSLRIHTRPVSPRDMRKGDLLFFNESGKKYSHVGIYIGNDLFVHAPSTGKTVRKDSLDDSYWKKHFLGARRFS
jgi:murein DD-endopeptidase